jgi:metallo-beta-lactamase superfamily protein
VARKSQKNAKRAKRRTSANPQGSSSYRAKVRMYRQGLGDCFLISLPRSDNDRPYTVMIDCGVILGTADASTKMTEVVENIVAATQGEIDLLLATHEHWDHVSGFVQAKDAFDKLKIHEVWLGWTENRNDPLTQKLKAQRDAALASLRLGLSRLQLAGDENAAEAVELGGVLEFFGAAKGASTEDALANVREMSSNLRFCLPSDAPVEPSGTGARFYVLGPPYDEKLLRKINPSTRDKETYGLAVDGFQLFMAGAGTALESKDRGRPFDGQYEIPFSYAREMEFFQQQYWTPADTTDNWRLIDSDWLGGSTELALQLDSLTNNTSLVLAIELADGDVLLFAADAQVGNWLSWQGLEWEVAGKKVTGPDLLKRAIFYKVGHHGSHNATLRDKGLEQMEKLRVAMLPVDQAMAKKKHWDHMPLDELVAALNEKAKGVVLRVDRPTPTTREQVVEDRLFFEVAF